MHSAFADILTCTQTWPMRGTFVVPQKNQICGVPAQSSYLTSVSLRPDGRGHVSLGSGNRAFGNQLSDELVKIIDEIK
jgi:hypothetical protein